MSGSHDSGSRVGAVDVTVVTAQLGRLPHPFGRVAARCPFGLPAVIEDLPYDGEGRPFPTLYYCTCPTLVAAVAALESAGGVAAWQERVAGDVGLRRGLAAATKATRRRRRELARRIGVEPRDGGASLATGVGGVRDVSRLKCLHAHVAHALARPGYGLGEAILADAGPPWCEDRRCATGAPADPRPGEGRREDPAESRS